MAERVPRFYCMATQLTFRLAVDIRDLVLSTPPRIGDVSFMATVFHLLLTFFPPLLLHCVPPLFFCTTQPPFTFSFLRGPWDTGFAKEVHPSAPFLSLSSHYQFFLTFLARPSSGYGTSYHSPPLGCYIFCHRVSRVPFCSVWYFRPFPSGV